MTVAIGFFDHTIPENVRNTLLKVIGSIGALITLYVTYQLGKQGKERNESDKS